jgi:hypothetical protein
MTPQKMNEEVLSTLKGIRSNVSMNDFMLLMIWLTLLFK